MAQTYAGTGLCADCHKDQFADWQRTEHATAFDSLYRDQKHFDVNCQSCHTTGFGHETGYDPIVGTQASRHVQCEACHGPGSLYIDPEIMSDREAYLAAGGRIPDDQPLPHVDDRHVPPHPFQPTS